jgi:hypothetical protein
METIYSLEFVVSYDDGRRILMKWNVWRKNKGFVLEMIFGQIRQAVSFNEILKFSLLNESIIIATDKVEMTINIPEEILEKDRENLSKLFLFAISL